MNSTNMYSSETDSPSSEIDLPDSPLDQPYEYPSIPAQRPSHHIEMTINGIPGFIIQNHTGYSPHDFKQLPKSFPDWDWQRVRSVNCFADCSKQGPQGVKAGLDDKYILPKPVYYKVNNGGIYFQDEKGRWPNHPGYNDPSWLSPEEKRKEKLEARVAAQGKNKKGKDKDGEVMEWANSTSVVDTFFDREVDADETPKGRAPLLWYHGAGFF